MKLELLQRRRVCKALALGLLASPICSAFGQPRRQLTVVVPYTPGGSGDYFARLYADGLSHVRDEKVLTDNRPGGNTTIGASYVAAAPGDGRTIFYTFDTNTLIQPLLIKDLKVELLRDLSPVMRVSSQRNILIARPDLELKDLSELIDSARKNPEKYTWAFTGEANVILMSSAAGIKLTRVGYRGGSQAIIDLMAGRVDLMYGSFAAYEQHIRTGKVKLLGVFDDKRDPDFPDVPTISEIVPKFHGSETQGIFVPAGTPKEIIDELYQTSARFLEAPDMRLRFQQRHSEIKILPPDEYREKLKEEFAVFQKAFREAGIVPS